MTAGCFVDVVATLYNKMERSGPTSKFKGKKANLNSPFKKTGFTVFLSSSSLSVTSPADCAPLSSSSSFFSAISPSVPPAGADRGSLVLGRNSRSARGLPEVLYPVLGLLLLPTVPPPGREELALPIKAAPVLLLRSCLIALPCGSSIVAARRCVVANGGITDLRGVGGVLTGEDVGDGGVV